VIPGRDPGSRKLRLFFALWPSAACRRALATATADAVARVDGVPVPAANLHVTLAFLGAVPGRTFVRLAAIGGSGAWPRVELAFDRLEYWAKPKVLVAVSSVVPRAGLQIVEHLWGALAPLGFARESRPWQPHLTLARKLRRPPPEDLQLPSAKLPPAAAAPWRLALVESTTHPEGARYRPLADWPLSKGTVPAKRDCPL
jgi:RNA 2',3'-cyclic 3'-phosphodiesterase